jgi:antitoxin YefM
MDRVYNDHKPFTITRYGEQSMVMLLLENYTALKNIAYINEG